MSMPINIIFDGPPGPVSGSFIEVENDDGQSISIGEWVERQNGYWALRITELPTCKEGKTPLTMADCVGDSNDR